MPLSAQSVQNVQSTIDSFTKEGSTGVNGLVFVAVDKSGKTLVEHASGTRSINSDVPMDMDTTFWLASCTKIITTIAVLQLVEQGKIPLDDADFIQKMAPEISEKKVFADGKNGVDQQKRITMRMLLSHTAGFGYSFLDPRINMQGRPSGISEFEGDVEDILRSPLVNQPGSVWEYGTNIDWAGLILERLTHTRLNTYMQTHIFAPLALPSLTTFPTPESQSNLAAMHQRDPSSGALSERNHIYRRALFQQTPEQQDRFFQSGGAGLFGKPREFVKVLAALLNGGLSQETGERILREETVVLMWGNQIPEHPDFARGGPPSADPTLANSPPELYPQEGNPPQGWGLSFFLTMAPGETGRGANTARWAGLANLYWWCDREKGIAGMIAGSVLPFGDPKVVTAWFGAEKGVYGGLE